MSRTLLMVLCSALILLHVSLLPAQKPDDSQPRRAIIVLDASGSMQAPIDGTAKIDIAKQVIHDLVETVDPALHLGLLAYGHRKKRDCGDIQLLIPAKPVNKNAFLRKVDAIKAVGMTPLTDAVIAAAKSLKFQTAPGSVILVTDGIETCRRDSCKMADLLAKRSLDLKVHVIAFDLTDQQTKTVRCFSQETGGELLEAQDAATLKDALEIAIEETESTNESAELDLSAATLEGPDSVPAGSTFEVSWKGPNNRSDFISIVPKDASDAVHGNYTYAFRGTPASLIAQVKPGAYELRYSTGRNHVLGRADIEVKAVTASLRLPRKVSAGSPIPVNWTGPANKGDYLTIAPKGAAVNVSQGYRYLSRAKARVDMTAPAKAGEFELRYVTGREPRILASQPITVIPAVATLDAPDEVMAGAPFEVKWTGPGNKGDYVTIVPTGAAPGTYGSYNSVWRKDATVTIEALTTEGLAEVRYMGRQKNMIASRPIRVVPVTIQLMAAEEVMAGSVVIIGWNGPGAKNDYVTIVLKGTPDEKYGDYKYTKTGKELAVLAPETAGVGEIRYIGKKRKVLHRKELTINPATATLIPAAKEASGKSLSVEWKGPASPRDQILIVAKGKPDSAIGPYVYARSGSPVKLRMPKDAGEYEIRYVTAKDKKVLARETIQVVRRP